jgi:hypothetical protein
MKQLLKTLLYPFAWLIVQVWRFALPVDKRIRLYEKHADRRWTPEQDKAFKKILRLPQDAFFLTDKEHAKLLVTASKGEHDPA